MAVSFVVAVLSIASLVMFILGLAILAKGRVKVSSTKVVSGAPAYLLGTLLLVVWPSRFVFGDAAVLILGALAILAVVLAVVLAKGEPREPSVP